MKKLLASVLAITMCATMAVPAFATANEIEINQGSTDKDAEIDVILEVAPTYTVTIPATVELEKEDNSSAPVTIYSQRAYITAENVRLEEGQTLQVTINTDYTLATSEDDAEYTLPYTISGDSGAVSGEDALVAEFETGTEEQSQPLTFRAEDPEYAGDYSDTVTFTVSVYEDTTITVTPDPDYGEGDITVGF